MLLAYGVFILACVLAIGIALIIKKRGAAHKGPEPK